MAAALVWFRRDLRCFDHAALSHALAHCERVHCAFVFDTEILDGLSERADRRVDFIRASVAELDAELDRMARLAGGAGAGVIVRHGAADREIPALAAELGVSVVFANRDYEPVARARDRRVGQALAAAGIAFERLRDQVIFDTDEILARSGRPFEVFTPYRNAWLRALEPGRLAPFPVRPLAVRLAPKPPGGRVPELAQIGFQATDLASAGITPGMSGGAIQFERFQDRLEDYAARRDFPATEGGSRLSVHLRFGTVSVRGLVAFAWTRGGAGAESWLAELVWREFYQMILWHHPHVVSRSFKPRFDAVRWDDSPEHFAAWCEGRTGYPLVDAAMRQLNTTGFMHNRLRMVAASFLTKDLGIDWRLGERYFAQQLADYDLAANNGGWQWAASTGCDAQPWFRIFNPVAQSRRFDPHGVFIRRFVPELERVPAAGIHAPWLSSTEAQRAAGVLIGRDYPMPCVDHTEARRRTLARFAVAKD